MCKTLSLPDNPLKIFVIFLQVYSCHCDFTTSKKIFR